MPDTIRHTFEEVPLVTEGGFAAFLVTVDAEISFWADGSWTIVGLMSEGYRPVKHSLEDHVEAVSRGQTLRSFDMKFVALDVGHPLYGMILHELENGAFRKHVDEAVRQAIRDNFSRNDDYRREREGV